MNKKLLSLAVGALLGGTAWAQATMPITLDIPDEATFANWTVIDNNATVSANTWAWDATNLEALYTEDKNNAADEWLIAPAVQLEAGVTYTIDYYILNRTTYSSDKQKYAITVGNAATIESQTTILTKDEALSRAYYYSKKSTSFTPEQSGIYYLGVHLYSDKWQGNCGFQKFVIDKAKVVPAQVTDLAVAAGEQGALSATLTWTMPSTTQYGGTLADLTGVRVMRGTEQIATVEGEVGQQMTYTDQALTEPGTYKYSVVAYNADGDAEGTATQVTSPWIGNDTPERVTELTATADGQNVSLTWVAPTTGTHQGYINPAELTYRILRGTEVLEENWAGELPYTDEVGQLNKYSYTVYAIFDGKQSSYASTSVVAGGAYEIPYTEEFASQTNFEFFTNLNAVDGGKTWTYSSYNGYPQFYDGSNDANVWLITPDINMQAGKTYKMTFQAWLSSTYNESYYKDMTVTLGQGKTIDAQATTLWTENINSTYKGNKELYFKVPADGIYNIGFNVQGAASYGSIYLDNINIVESEVIPEAATDINVVAGEQGALTATVTWMNPAKDLAGEDLEALTAVKVYRDYDLIATLDQMTPGQQATYVDEAVPAPGFYKYAVVPYVDDRAGERIESEQVWIGNDVPAAVTEPTLTEVDGNRVITWVAPTQGVNGGYINTEALTYRVVRNTDGEEVANGLTECTYTDQDEIEGMANLSYTIYAVIGEQQSEGATTNALVVGDAFELPYVADMADAGHMALWTIVNANGDVTSAGKPRTWTYANNIMVMDGMVGTNDDYVFTPPFRAPKGKLKLTYTVKGYSYRYCDAYEVVLTNTTDVAAPAAGAPRRAEGETFNEVIETVAQNEVATSMFVERTVDFNTPETGVYYIGFHDVSTDPWGMSIGATQVEVMEVVTGVNDIHMVDVKSISYVNVAGVKSDKPFKGVNIVVMELNDGTTVTRKAIF